MLLEIIIVLAFLGFGIRSLIFLYGVGRERNKSHGIHQNFKPFVSVVVPARNESANIRNCLLSIAKSNYDTDKFEIIAVNDRSDDNTLEIMQDCMQQISNLKTLNIENENQKANLKGKPGALQAGINIANGELILMTDADCTVNENWISTIVNSFANPNIGIVASFTNISGTRCFDKHQAIEWIYLHTMASGGIGLNQPLGCYGNNLSVRKSVFDKIGGYQNIKFSVTEDLALLQAIKAVGYKARYIADHNSLITTQPCKNFKEYTKQRHRWAIGGLDLGWRATIFVISSGLYILGLLASIVFLEPLLFVALILFRWVFDILMLVPIMISLKIHSLIKWIPFSSILFTVGECIVPFLILKKDVEWKGQIFKKHN